MHLGPRGAVLEIPLDAAFANLMPNVTRAHDACEFEDFEVASFSNAERQFAADIERTSSSEAQTEITRRGSEDGHAHEGMLQAGKPGRRSEPEGTFERL